VVDSTEKLSGHPIMHRNRNLVGIHTNATLRGFT
jgi:hypothetical protein